MISFHRKIQNWSTKCQWFRIQCTYLWTHISGSFCGCVKNLFHAYYNQFVCVSVHFQSINRLFSAITQRQKKSQVTKAESELSRISLSMQEQWTYHMAWISRRTMIVPTAINTKNPLHILSLFRLFFSWQRRSTMHGSSKK